VNVIEILDIRPELGGGSTIARFDAELQSGIRLFNLKLSDSGRGPRVFAPSAFGGAVATFSRETAAQLAAAAQKKLGEIAQNANLKPE
jgi:hypothetical protein